MTHKLNDVQLILLATACQREDGNLLPPPESIGSQADRIRKAVAALIKRWLAIEVDVTDPARQWREEEDRRVGVVITDAGRAIIAAEELEAPDGAAIRPATAEQPAEASLVIPKPLSKIAMVTDLLRHENGATMAELVAATGWLPHTTRAALTGLRRKGHSILRATRDGATCYHIAGAA